MRCAHGPSGLDRAARSLADAAPVTLDGRQTSGAYGSAAEPAIVRLTGQAEIAGTFVVTGILVCDAPLRVRGRLEVDGLLLAPQGIDVEGEVEVTGASWLGASLRLPATGRIDTAYAERSIDRAREVGGAA